MSNVGEGGGGGDDNTQRIMYPFLIFFTCLISTTLSALIRRKNVEGKRH